jgi:glycine/D-amino acid oxidase-like deaminating enzyme
VQRVVICGGGAIGASVAYFLSRRGVRPIVVERVGVASAASGKSGGFLAHDWCDGTPLEALARRSFVLHAGLGAAIDADWGYRRLTTYAGSYGDRRSAASLLRPRQGTGVGWVAAGVAVDRRLGTTDTTAQVHPGAFTTALLRAAVARGGELVPGEVTDVARDGPRAAGVVVDGRLIAGDAVVIAMGPWSVRAARWLALPAIYALKGHSLIFETGSTVPPEALFLEVHEETGEVHTPEVFPRADGTTYVCAISSDTPLPTDPGAVTADPGAFDRLHAMCARLSPALAQARVIARQACYRPVTADGLPLIGRIRGLERGYVATGHSVWGILNAPATGEALAELIVDGTALSTDLSPFDPGRLPPLAWQTRRGTTRHA